ncbi:glycoside hydrolase family 127 protein, partial [bacterium]
HVGFVFDDSDVYKWAEACAYALATTKNDALRKLLDEAIELVVSAQRPDGYLDTYIQLDHPDDAWRNLNALHEMYCAGHLIEAGVALSENLGDRRLLDVSIRFADHIMSVFGPEGRLGYCGHEEIELALVKLAVHTGEAKYREFARWLVESRGSRPSPFEAELKDPAVVALSPWGGGLLDGTNYSGEYNQDHAPIREHDAVVGHAVRAMYLYIAAADLADGQDDAALETALQRAWDSLVKRRMYVTGGIGPSRHNEGFTQDYDLPNLSAYSETCAAIGLMLWGQKMLEMTGNAEFAETVERALFNGALAGISLGGDRFFYDNPLESRGGHDRTAWFGCACCPPNIARTIGNLASFVAGASEEAFYLH